MAYTTIVFEHPKTGMIKEAPVGFSWTVALFGFLPPLLRGDWKWAAINFILMLVTAGFSILVFMFIYNRLYITDLIRAGFKAKSITIGSLQEVETRMDITIPRLEAIESTHRQ